MSPGHKTRCRGRQRQLVCALFVISMGPLSICGLARSQSPSVDELLGQLLVAYDRREAQLNPCLVKYRALVTETSAWQAVGKSSNNAPKSDLKWEVLADYARKGNKWRAWANRSHPMAPNQGQEDFLIFNGETQFRPSNRPGEYLLSSSTDQTRGYMVEPPLVVVGEDSLHKVLRNWREGKARISSKSVLQVPEFGDGAFLLELTSPTGASSKYWILPQQDYALRKWEMCMRRGHLTCRSESTGYSEHHGIFFPTQGRKEHYLPSGKLGYAIEFTVTQFETSASNVPDRLFQFAVPPGSTLYDSDRNVSVRDVELSQSHLNEVVSKLAPPKLWQNWLLVGGIALVLLALVCGYLLWRRRRQGLESA